MNNGKIEKFKINIAEKYGFQNLLTAGKKEKVCEKLFQLIGAYSDNEKFEEASALRSWIMEIDPMALNTIIQAAQVIDDAKFAAIKHEHFIVWMSLAKLLSREEFSALYHSLFVKNYPTNTVVIKQGTYFPALLLINNGRLKLTTFSEGNHIHLKSVDAGEIIGSNTFFDPSTWTYSVHSEAVEVAILTYKNLQKLTTDFPSLESKLYDYCTNFVAPDSALQKSRKGRRAHIRNKLSGKTAIQIFDRNGASMVAGVNGDLFDISKGGVSCLIRSSKKTNAAKLFGRKIRASLPLNGKAKTMNRQGVVVAVKGFRAAGNEYSLHVEFENILNDADLSEIVTTGRA